jgi:hypothetical protein
MNTQEFVGPAEEMMSPAEGADGPAWSDWRGSLAAWLNRCADKWAAAVAYDELSRLSDAHLEHRGLRRDSLARDLSE